VQKEDPKANEEKVMERMLSMVHSLAASAEVYLKHNSISKYGGYSVLINGIKIFKVKFFILYYISSVSQLLINIICTV
jgi:hypothetical protein